MNKYLVALLMIGSLLVVGCNKKQSPPKELIHQTVGEIMEEVNATGTITDAQAEILSTVEWGTSLGRVEHITLIDLITITDAQAEILSKVDQLYLGGLTSITDAQAESFSKVDTLYLGGLTSITDAQAESLSKVETLLVPEDLQPLIDKYRNE